MKDSYLFTSKRLGFKNWGSNDFKELAKMNADSDVMEFFPAVLSDEETQKLLTRLQNHYDEYGYTYFACELLETKEWIGFIGLAFQRYETDFTPATDIGWRLKKSAWGKGYATEGAKRCLDFAFNDLKLERIVSTCTANNKKSENVMKKIGMTKKGSFNHPKLVEYPDYKECIWYEIKNYKV